ncbi:hypothetical protein BZA77DRAFT_320218 [Pyronema omphalodes]|nr:hypothetical protein BZA77DRAFT_320218 [Pyronema omphalodes]
MISFGMLLHALAAFIVLAAFIALATSITSITSPGTDNTYTHTDECSSRKPHPISYQFEAAIKNSPITCLPHHKAGRWWAATGITGITGISLGCLGLLGSLGFLGLLGPLCWVSLGVFQPFQLFSSST